MRHLKQSIGLLAILAMALHTLLWAVAVPVAAANGAADPFSVICHSGGDSAAAGDSQDGPAPTPSKACDHCNLCSTTAAPATPDVVLVGRLLPERVLERLSPAVIPRRDGVTANPKLARGPPQQA